MAGSGESAVSISSAAGVLFEVVELREHGEGCVTAEEQNAHHHY